MEECCCCQSHCGRVVLLSGLCGRVLLLSGSLWKNVAAIRVTVEECCCYQGYVEEWCCYQYCCRRVVLPTRSLWKCLSKGHCGNVLVESGSPKTLAPTVARRQSVQLPPSSSRQIAVEKPFPVLSHRLMGVIPLFLWTKFLFDFPSTHSCVIHFSSFP